MGESPQVTHLVVWGMVICGITLVVTQSSLLAPSRAFAHRLSPWLGTLARCPMCLSWWVGAGLSYGLGFGVCASALGSRPLAALGDAFAASALCWTWHVALEALGSGKL